MLEHASELAARHDACDIQVIVVQSRSAAWTTRSNGWSRVRDKLPTFHAGDHDWTLRMHVRISDSADQIAALAGEASADVIVIGRFGRHRTSWRHGSVTDRVLAQAPCSTLVVQLADRAVESDRQCPACVDVRRGSDGERWFCDQHLAPDRAISIKFPMAFDCTDGA